MAKVKNVSGAPWVDAETNTRVAKGGVLEVPDERAWGYVQMAGVWEAADEATAALAEGQRPKSAEEQSEPEPEPKRTKKAAAAAEED